MTRNLTAAGRAGGGAPHSSETRAETGRLERILLGVALVVLALFYLKSLGGPSLWLDEAWEANYYAGFSDAPWYNRPVLYMTFVRALVAAFGPSEFVLRLLPCLAGLLTIVLTFRLARDAFGRTEAWIAAATLALAPPFLFSAHQLKHYTFDALFTVLLLFVYERYRQDRARRRLLIYLATAVVSFGFSFTGVFVVVALLVVELVATRFAVLKVPAFVAGHVVIALAFVAVYLGLYIGGPRDSLLVEYFATDYAPVSEIGRIPEWLVWQTRSVIRDLMGIRSLVALGLILVAGWVAALRGRSGALAWFVPVVLLLNVAASVPRLYPYGVVRLSLFITPILCILFAAGLGLLLQRGDRAWLRYLAVVGLLYPLLYGNVTGARPYLAGGWQREDIRGLVHVLTSERLPGEGLYVNQDAEPAFRFYWHRSGRDLEQEEIVWGERHRVAPEMHAEQIAGLPSRYDSFWALFSHVRVSELSVLRGFILEHYDLERSEVAGDARLELYRLKAAKTED